jgi:hypothetical protein
MLKFSGAAAALAAGVIVSESARAARAIPKLDSCYIYYCPELVEITEPGPIILPDGTSQCSWSRRPWLDLNFEDARFYAVPSLQRYRMKKWDMYHMAAPDCYLSFLVAWIGYGAFASASVYDRKERADDNDISLKLPKPELTMMRDSTAGRSEYESAKAHLTFEVQGERRRIQADFPGFAGKGLRAAIDLTLPADHESVCATHLTNPRRCHYGHKINCMTAQGEAKLGEKTFRLDPSDSFGMLDFGRGYYPPKQFWYWATASGRDEKGKLAGWNLGHGNSPAETGENALFYDGRLHKIGPVKCEVPRDDPMKPWRVWSDDLSVDLCLVPEYARPSNLNLGIAYSLGITALGNFSGKITLDSGEVVPIKDIFGLFEWFNQKW